MKPEVRRPRSSKKAERLSSEVPWVDPEQVEHEHFMKAARKLREMREQGKLKK